MFGSVHHAKKVLREISLLRQLTKVPKNLFTTRLLDVIIPAETAMDLQTYTEIFFVIEHVDYDLKQILSTQMLP